MKVSDRNKKKGPKYVLRKIETPEHYYQYGNGGRESTS